MTDVVTLTIADLVDATLARLQAKITGFAIEAFPDRPDAYKLTHQRGAFLVAYRGAEYEPTEDTDAIAQVRRPMVDVVVQGRALNGAASATAMLDMARAALVGFAVPGFTKFAAVRERFIDRVENVWSYQLTVATSTIAIELDDDVVGPLLEHLSFVGPSDTLEITDS